MLVPGGTDDMGPVRGEDGGGIGQECVGNMLLEGYRGVVVQQQRAESGVGEENV